MTSDGKCACITATLLEGARVQVPSGLSACTRLAFGPSHRRGGRKAFNSAREICHYRRGPLREATIQDFMMYMCSEKLTLDGQQLTHLGEPLETENQKAIEDDAEPIRDEEEIKESEDFEGNFELEGPYQAECTLAETDRSSMPSQSYDV